MSPAAKDAKQIQQPLMPAAEAVKPANGIFQFDDRRNMAAQQAAMKQHIGRQLDAARPGLIQMKQHFPDHQIIQCKIGPKGHGKKVLRIENSLILYARAVYTDSKKTKLIGYKLYQDPALTIPYASGATVGQDDDHYNLYVEPAPSQPAQHSVRSNQQARRVITTMAPATAANAIALQLLPPKDKKKKAGATPQTGADFSYGDLSAAAHSTLESTRQSRQETDAAVSHGAALPVRDGVIPIDPTKNRDLQLIAHHLLQYQQFHNPPLTSSPRSSENAWRAAELGRIKRILQTTGVDGLMRILPKQPATTPSTATTSAATPSTAAATASSSASSSAATASSSTPSSAPVTATHDVRGLFPGPLDVSFPPPRQGTFLTYETNKAVYLLSKKLRLAAFQNQQKQKGKNKRRKLQEAETEALGNVISTQDGSTATSPDAYLAKTLKVKRKKGYVEVTDAESDSEEVYRNSDPLPKALDRRKTIQNTLGLLVKQLNQHKLDALAAQAEARASGQSSASSSAGTASSLSAVATASSSAAAAAAAATQDPVPNYDAVLAHLNRRHGLLHQRHGTQFDALVKLSKLMQQKLELLKKMEAEQDELDPDGSNAILQANLKYYSDMLNAAQESLPVGLLPADSDAFPLHGIGPKKMKGLMKRLAARSAATTTASATASSSGTASNTSATSTTSAVSISAAASASSTASAAATHGSPSTAAPATSPQKPKAKASKAKAKAPARKAKAGGQPLTMAAWAALYGGTPQYGQSDGNNCLIYAIAFAARFDISDDRVAEIRASLADADFAGVDVSGFLPAYGRVIDRIAQHVLAEMLGNQAVPQLTIQIDSALEGIRRVVEGNGGTRIYIFHDGVHYWWLKTG
jgi:hypothetical protein